jgi:hypothetical protein
LLPVIATFGLPLSHHRTVALLPFFNRARCLAPAPRPTSMMPSMVWFWVSLDRFITTRPLRISTIRTSSVCPPVIR